MSAVPDPPAERSVPVTVVFPVLNEAENLPAALVSVAWATQIFVVDSGSTDATRAIAQEAGATVVQFNYVAAEGVKKKKAWSLAALPFATEWVLYLDADERVTAALRDEILAVLASPGCDGYYLDREMIFRGRPLRSYRPDWNLRLFRHGLASIEDLGMADLPGTGDNEIHEHFELEGSIGFLRAPLLHDDYRGIERRIVQRNDDGHVRGRRSHGRRRSHHRHRGDDDRARLDRRLRIGSRRSRRLTLIEQLVDGRDDGEQEDPGSVMGAAGGDQLRDGARQRAVECDRRRRRILCLLAVSGHRPACGRSLPAQRHLYAGVIQLRQRDDDCRTDGHTRQLDDNDHLVAQSVDRRSSGDVRRDGRRSGARRRDSGWDGHVHGRRPAHWKRAGGRVRSRVDDPGLARRRRAINRGVVRRQQRFRRQRRGSADAAG
jgi:hypothetical protein